MRILQRIFAVLISMASSSVFAQSSPTFGADARINFTGTILPPSCDIDSTTANQTVKLGSAPVANFAAVGSTSNATAFNLKLLNCSTGATVTMNVAGTTDTAPSVLKNTGTAKQIGVQLLQASNVGATTGTPLTLNTAINKGTIGPTNTMTIPLVAQFYRLGTLTAGSVAATATFTFTYN
jgi:major type 1 subunit fimbrin (pilin)